MAKLKKSWREKLHEGKEAQVVEITENMSQRWGTGTVVIPAPIEVDEIMKSVPYGKLITINQIREKVARKHGATIGCPITTGLFAGIAARAAGEDEAEGKTDVTPYWRTLKSKGELNEKYPGGLEGQATRLMSEGHDIENSRNGKPKKIKDFEKSLVNI